MILYPIIKSLSAIVFNLLSCEWFVKGGSYFLDRWKEVNTHATIPVSSFYYAGHFITVSIGIKLGWAGALNGVTNPGCSIDNAGVNSCREEGLIIHLTERQESKSIHGAVTFQYTDQFILISWMTLDLCAGSVSYLSRIKATGKFKDPDKICSSICLPDFIHSI